MGVGKHYDLHETDDTRAASRAAAFDEIIEKITAYGGKITKDEEAPLYIDIGNQDFEVGTERTVEFTLGKFDFQLIHKVENQILQGASRQKHLEPLSPPRIKDTLKRRPALGGDWQVIDLEDML